MRAQPVDQSYGGHRLGAGLAAAHEDDDPECDGAAHKFDPHLTFGGLRSLVRLNQPRREGHSA